MKKNVIFGLVFFICIFLCTSCVKQINEMMQSWIGHHYSELIMKWGIPTQIMKDGLGGYILIYEQEVTLYQTQAKSYTRVTGTLDGNWLNAHATTTYYPSQNIGYTRYRMFQTDNNGIIVHWAWRGL